MTIESNKIIKKGNTSIQDQIDDLNDALSKLRQNPSMQDHFHNGFDASMIRWFDISQRIVHIHYTLPGTTPATAANYGAFYIVPFTCILTNFQEVHETAGSSDGTLMLEKLTGTEAPGAGTDMLASAIDLTATANTVQTGVLSATTANLNLAIGDRLAIEDAATLTSIAGLSVIVELQII